jgi:hypothetical protein
MSIRNELRVENDTEILRSLLSLRACDFSAFGRDAILQARGLKYLKMAKKSKKSRALRMAVM